MSSEIKILQKENRELKKEINQLKELVTVDYLTKIYNRRAFSHFLKNLCQEVKWTAQNMSRRQRKEFFSLLLIDIDDFKKINDAHGHLYGDKVLQKVARFLENSVRDFDVVARWGGEEFVIILQEATLRQAQARAEVILKNAPKKLSITFSIGVVESSPGLTEKSIFHKADRAVYKAKRLGKNQIVLA